ncbi:hypothetical protein Tco_0351112 [Tanacetum coccineum]
MLKAPSDSSCWLGCKCMEELLQFKTSTSLASSGFAYWKEAIGNKKGLQNRKMDRGIVIRNKAWLVARGVIDKKCLFTQPPGFKDPVHQDKVIRMWLKALYGLHHDKSYGLQVQQKEDGIFISQDKYVAGILKKFNYTDVKSASTPVDLEKPLVKDGDADDVDVHLYRSMIGSLMDSLFELVAYTDSDYAGATQDRKFITGSCQFLGNRLISWQCKKQTMIATSTTKSEYVAAASCCEQIAMVAAANCCGHVLWIQNQMLDYGYNLMNTNIYIDNESTICIVKNPVSHSKTKHIKIRYHFIRDSYEKKLIQVIKIHTDKNVVDLLTKAFDVSRFNFLIASIGLLNL